MKERLDIILQEIDQHLTKGIIQFWTNNGVDKEFGGYLTCFDENGKLQDEDDKYIDTQARMIWGYSAFYQYAKNEEYLENARQGVKFLVDHFWDKEYGGWFWKTNRGGDALDKGKEVYGQVFVVYALAKYSLETNDSRGITYANLTFDLLMKYCVDTLHGGYYENLERDWSLSASGYEAGDRKSLDIHMHVLEAYTLLFRCTKQEIHRRRLEEICELIPRHMIDWEAGCGGNQYALDFEILPPINIRRTWNAERETGEVLEEKVDSTSYGHNLELIWLHSLALDELGISKNDFIPMYKKLASHALRFGVDKVRGGVFRDGPHIGDPVVRDKEWWQNCESMVGFLEAYQLTGDTDYLTSFISIWDFAVKFMIHHEVGEWRQLLTEDGKVISGAIGIPWKVMYHSGRAMLECKNRLERILKGL